jgi:hypothetical protein
MIDFQAESARLLQRAREILPQILPGGRWRGHEWVCGSIQGGPGNSLSVNSLTGAWADFAAGEDMRGRDLISLIATVKGVTNVAAAVMYGADDRPKNGNGHHAAEPPEIHFQTPPHTVFRPDMFKHSRHGTPSAHWVYRERDGTAIFIVARYDGEAGKQIVPWIWDGLHWLPKAPPKPRPLYGLPSLKHVGRALIVEGEKACDAAAFYFPSRPCLTWMGGAQALKHADWQPIAGMEVTLWPDADEPGRGCMARIAERLLTLGCTVAVVDTAELPDKWDLADALAEGWDAARVIAYAKPRTRPVALPAPEVEYLPDPPEALAVKGVERLQRTPEPGTHILEHGAVEGSLTALWQTHFVTKNNGTPVSNAANVATCIQLAKIDVWYDLFCYKIMRGKHEWTDQNTLELLIHIQRDWGLKDVRKSMVEDGIAAYAFAHARNPMVEWLDSLHHDGGSYVESLISKGFGAPNNAYTRAVGRCFMVSIVARALSPGCKVDTMPIFEGRQGAYKSTALKIIGGAYYTEVHESIHSKDFFISIKGKSLGEWSEIQQMRGGEQERYKAVISTASDRFRAPYATNAQDHPRTCVFAGTTNVDDWNNDETGARRFWPVACGKIDLDWIRGNRQQLYAEAVMLYRSGASWWDVPETDANEERVLRRFSDPWDDAVEGFCAGRDWVNLTYILEQILELKPKDQTVGTQRRVGAILRALGFEKRSKRVGDVIEKRWERVKKGAP